MTKDAVEKANLLIDGMKDLPEVKAAEESVKKLWSDVVAVSPQFAADAWVEYCKEMPGTVSRIRERLGMPCS